MNRRANNIMMKRLSNFLLTGISQALARIVEMKMLMVINANSVVHH
jgi:hypothetical protein